MSREAPEAPKVVLPEVGGKSEVELEMSLEEAIKVYEGIGDRFMPSQSFPDKLKEAMLILDAGIRKAEAELKDVLASPDLYPPDRKTDIGLRATLDKLRALKEAAPEVFRVLETVRGKGVLPSFMDRP
jgi:hypothetical protein